MTTKISPTDSPGKVLLVDDTRENLRLLMTMLKDVGFSVFTADHGQLALDNVESISPDLILLDIMMPDIDGYEVCRRLKERPQTAEIPVIFISALRESFDKLQAFASGGVDYISKPFAPEEVVARVQTHIELQRALLTVKTQKEALEQEKADREKAEREMYKYQSQLTGILTGQLLHPKVFSGIVTKNEKMLQLFHYIEALSCSSEPVLIHGESGVGKELIAKAVHDVSTPDAPWVAVNIAGFDDNHFSDTLFGHTKGAFTGANQARDGLLEKASGGTLFLDEIGDLNLPSQIKLLRLLQEKEYLPLGSDTPLKADVRILVATNVDLKQKMENEEFRADLFYRLSAHCIEILPLRERKEDIPLLLDHYLEEAAQQMGKKKPSYPAELPVLLSNYYFPGNIRELRAIIYDAISKHQNYMLSMESFEKAIGLTGKKGPALTEGGPQEQLQFPEILPTLKAYPKLLIEEALRRTEGNQKMAAKLLGVTPAALSLRLKRKAGS